MLYLFPLIYTFLDDHSYRIKLAGDEELYIAKVRNSIRLISPKDLNSSGVESIGSILGQRNIRFEFCRSYLTAKRDDPGVVASEERKKENEWDLRAVENGYQLLYNGKCLCQAEEYDKTLNGFFMNTRNCDEKVKNVFVFFDAGPSENFCDLVLKEKCEMLRNGKFNNEGRGRDRSGRDRDWDRYDLGDSNQYPEDRRDNRPNYYQSPKGNRYDDGDDNSRDMPQRSRRGRNGRSDDDSRDRSARRRNDRDDVSDYIDDNRPKSHHSVPEDIYHHH